MYDAGRYKLLGKYRTPRFHYGKAVFCQVRGWVVITGLHEAPIPWPVCKRPGRSTGRTSLVVYRGLIRALRRESEQAVCQWWGVSPTTVWKWRKALGLAGKPTEGTVRRLRDLAARPAVVAGLRKAQDRADDPERNAKISRALTGRPKPPQVAEAVRRANRGKKASAETRRKMSEAQRRRQAFPVPRRRWEPWEDALLGILPDAEVARQTGWGEDAVRSRRARLLIRAPRAGGG
jgi:hypothetical protein